jgi:hypothetical protein
MPSRIKATPTIEQRTATRILTGNALDTVGVLRAELVAVADAVVEASVEDEGDEAVPNLEDHQYLLRTSQCHPVGNIDHM